MSRGREVWLLKRARIFVGDVWGAFQVEPMEHLYCHRLHEPLKSFYKAVFLQLGCSNLKVCICSGLQGKGLGAFHDIGELTMFADYRVPVVLRQLDILQYSPELAHKVLHPCICTLTRASCQEVVKSY